MSKTRPPTRENGTPELNDRLDSWKEIAAYLNRGVRTVIRWEAEEGLPIHRHLHGSRGSVHAHKSELDAWMERRTVKPPSVEATEPFTETAVPEPGLPFRRRWPMVAAAGGLVVAVALLLLTTRPRSVPDPAIVPLTAYPGTEMYPTFSPEGTRVAFAWDSDEPSNFDLYEITLGSEAPPLRLTRKPSRHLFAAWSPDGIRSGWCAAQIATTTRLPRSRLWGVTKGMWVTSSQTPEPRLSVGRRMANGSSHCRMFGPC